MLYRCNPARSFDRSVESHSYECNTNEQLKMITQLLVNANLHFAHLDSIIITKKLIFAMQLQ